MKYALKHNTLYSDVNNKTTSMIIFMRYLIYDICISNEQWGDEKLPADLIILD
jgi:hypothetical protein